MLSKQWYWLLKNPVECIDLVWIIFPNGHRHAFGSFQMTSGDPVCSYHHLERTNGFQWPFAVIVFLDAPMCVCFETLLKHWPWVWWRSQGRNKIFIWGCLCKKPVFTPVTWTILENSLLLSSISQAREIATNITWVRFSLFPLVSSTFISSLSSSLLPFMLVFSSSLSCLQLSSQHQPRPNPQQPISPRSNPFPCTNWFLSFLNPYHKTMVFSTAF